MMLVSIVSEVQPEPRTSPQAGQEGTDGFLDSEAADNPAGHKTEFQRQGGKRCRRVQANVSILRSGYFVSPRRVARGGISPRTADSPPMPPCREGNDGSRPCAETRQALARDQAKIAGIDGKVLINESAHEAVKRPRRHRLKGDSPWRASRWP